MKKTFLKIAVIITCLLSIGILFIAANTHAASVCDSNVAKEVREAAGCDGTKDELPNTIVGILNAIIAVSGLIAVVFVIIGGINYMTSAGDAGKVEKAKKTILYAVIGLVITVLAFAIVNFTISNIIEGKSNANDDKDDTSQHSSSILAMQQIMIKAPRENLQK